MLSLLYLLFNLHVSGLLHVVVKLGLAVCHLLAVVELLLLLLVFVLLVVIVFFLLLEVDAIAAVEELVLLGWWRLHIVLLLVVLLLVSLRAAAAGIVLRFIDGTSVVSRRVRLLQGSVLLLDVLSLIHVIHVIHNVLSIAHGIHCICELLLLLGLFVDQAKLLKYRYGIRGDVWIVIAWYHLRRQKLDYLRVRHLVIVVWVDLLQ